MAILQNQSNIDNSPWYDIMEERAVAWNEFAKENNLTIEGYYNANIVTFEIETHKLNIFGIRQVSNVSSLTNIGLEQVSEELNIKIETPINSSKHFIRVRKSKIWNNLRKQFKHSKIHNNYHITYTEESVFEELNKIELFEFEKLKKLTINRKGIKLILFELPSKTNTISSFLNFYTSLK